MIFSVHLQLGRKPPQRLSEFLQISPLDMHVLRAQQLRHRNTRLKRHIDYNDRKYQNKSKNENKIIVNKMSQY